MRRLLSAWLLTAVAAFAAAQVLIVADEIPAMETLAARLKVEGIESTIVMQGKIPAGPARYSAMVVYIHKNIGEPAETAFIDYAQSGGKLVLLHHSISSGKRRNRFWFPFLKLTLPQGDVDQGGYKWIDPVTMDIVNLASKDPITTRNVKYDLRVPYRGEELPGFRLEETEVYLNHTFSEPRTVLLGLKYTDPKSGKTYMQDSAGWYMKAGKGTVMYFMPGHSVKEFQHPVYGQILVNAIRWPAGR